MSREYLCDGWYLEELTPGRFWHVTRDGYKWGDVMVDPNHKCDHCTMYLARWTHIPADPLAPFWHLGDYHTHMDAVHAIITRIGGDWITIEWPEIEEE